MHELLVKGKENNVGFIIAAQKEIETQDNLNTGNYTKLMIDLPFLSIISNPTLSINQ